MKKWMIAGLVILALAVAAPYAVGVLTEQQWQSATRQLNNETPFVQVHTHEYDRHYFGGQVVGTVRFNLPESGETHRVPYVGEVSHGVTGSAIEFTPTEGAGEVLQELFPDEQPQLTITTHIWGTMDVDLAVPAISLSDDATGETMDVAALSAWAGISDQGDAVEIDLDWPGMELKGSDMRMAVSGVTMTQDAERVQGQIWQGEITLEVESLKAEPVDQPAIEVRSLAMDSDTEADDERLQSDTALTAESITIGDRSYGPHCIEFALKDLSIPAWNQLMDVTTELRVATAQRSSNTNADQEMQQQMEIMRRMGNAARDVAAAGMSLGMPVIELETPDGEVTGSWELAHPQVPEDERDQMQLVMQRVSGDLSLMVPVALVEANPAIAQNVQGLMSQGLITREDDAYRVKATLKDMMINVNGQEIPLPPLI